MSNDTEGHFADEAGLAEWDASIRRRVAPLEEKIDAIFKHYRSDFHGMRRVKTTPPSHQIALYMRQTRRWRVPVWWRRWIRKWIQLERFWKNCWHLPLSWKREGEYGSRSQDKPLQGSTRVEREEQVYRITIRTADPFRSLSTASFLHNARMPIYCGFSVIISSRASTKRRKDHLLGRGCNGVDGSCYLSGRLRGRIQGSRIYDRLKIPYYW